MLVVAVVLAPWELHMDLPLAAYRWASAAWEEVYTPELVLVVALVLVYRSLLAQA